MRSRLHTEAEWLAVRPIIEQLYIRELRPLSRVMKILETTHNFKASIGMYKRTIRAWGLYKNNRPKGQESAATVATTHKAIKPCRYLRQNRVDESLNNLLYLFPSWIAHADAVWDVDARMSCPPRAAYIYDDFTQSIAAAVAAFECGETTNGGADLRQAFVELEATLMPRTRSIFSLNSLFFALATLNQANLHKASRLLIAHATELVALRTRRDDCPAQRHVRGGNVETPRGQALVRGYEGEHVAHPFPQILHQLQLLAAELEHDDSGMTDLVLRMWATYHRLAGTASARSVSSRASQRGFWNHLIRIQSSPGLPQFLNSKATNWMDTAQPVLHHLHKLLGHAKKTGDEEMMLVYSAEVIAVHSFGNSQGLEDMALSLLETVERKCATPGTDDIAAIEEWGSIAAFQLVRHYLRQGDWRNSVKYMSRTFPAKFRAEWGALFESELRCWIQEQGVLGMPPRFQ